MASVSTSIAICAADGSLQPLRDFNAQQGEGVCVPHASDTAAAQFLWAECVGTGVRVDDLLLPHLHRAPQAAGGAWQWLWKPEVLLGLLQALEHEEAAQGERPLLEYLGGAVAARVNFRLVGEAVPPEQLVRARGGRVRTFAPLQAFPRPLLPPACTAATRCPAAAQRAGVPQFFVLTPASLVSPLLPPQASWGIAESAMLNIMAEMSPCELWLKLLSALKLLFAKELRLAQERQAAALADAPPAGLSAALQETLKLDILEADFKSFPLRPGGPCDIVLFKLCRLSFLSKRLQGRLASTLLLMVVDDLVCMAFEDAVVSISRGASRLLPEPASEEDEDEAVLPPAQLAPAVPAAQAAPPAPAVYSVAEAASRLSPTFICDSLFTALLLCNSSLLLSGAHSELQSLVHFALVEGLDAVSNTWREPGRVNTTALFSHTVAPRLLRDVDFLGVLLPHLVSRIPQVDQLTPGPRQCAQLLSLPASQLPAALAAQTPAARQRLELLFERRDGLLEGGAPFNGLCSSLAQALDFRPLGAGNAGERQLQAAFDARRQPALPPLVAPAEDGSGDEAPPPQPRPTARAAAAAAIAAIAAAAAAEAKEEKDRKRRLSSGPGGKKGDTTKRGGGGGAGGASAGSAEEEEDAQTAAEAHASEEEGRSTGGEAAGARTVVQGDAAMDDAVAAEVPPVPELAESLEALALLTPAELLLCLPEALVRLLAHVRSAAEDARRLLQQELDATAQALRVVQHRVAAAADTVQALELELVRLNSSPGPLRLC